MIKKIDWKIWKTIHVGASSIKEVRERLASCERNITEEANKQLNNVCVCGTKESPDFVEASVDELGFKFALYEDILKRADDIGLKRCQKKDAPFLRLRHEEKEIGECLWIATETMNGTDGRHKIFNIYKSGHGMWLDVDNGDPKAVWFADHKFIFRLA